MSDAIIHRIAVADATFADYAMMCDRAREAHVSALEAQKRKALSPDYTDKQRLIDVIEQARQRERNGPSTMRVYFVQESGLGLIKIGTSMNVSARMSALSRGTPHDLTLLTTIAGGFAVESEIHRHFERDRVRGEWFRPIPDLLAYLEEIKV